MPREHRTPAQVRIIEDAKIIEASPRGYGFTIMRERWEPATPANRARAVWAEVRLAATAVSTVIGRLWMRRHPVSRVWWLMVRRSGLWFTIRYIRISRPKGPPPAELVELAAAHPGQIVARITQEAMTPDLTPPAWWPARLARVWHPHGKLLEIPREDDHG